MTETSPVAEPGDAARPDSPYVGLVPFGEGDAAFFFGRSTETAIVAANLRSSRLTIVYGPSGVGKSSLLMAGVVHRLREEARAAGAEAAFPVCVYRAWPGDPVAGLRDAIDAALGLPGEAEATPMLADAVRARVGEGQRLLVVLDQFEEYFQYHPGEGGDETLSGFAGELAAIVNDPNVPAHVLLSVREDAWAKLDLFEGHIPSLFNNYVRVDHLDRDAAREAIEAPIAAWNKTLPPGEERYSIELALTGAVLEAAAGTLALTPGTETPAQVVSPGQRIEAPFLQLVLERLWRATLADGAHVLTLARLQALGGARKIVADHLLDALAQLTPAEQDTASDCFRFLVSTDRTKIARPASDLAEWTQRPEPQVTAVLEKLCSAEGGRILRENAPTHEGATASYELFHDILAAPILEWRRTYEADRRRRAVRRRMLRVGSVLVALIAVFAGLGIWALIQRSDAISATKSANSLGLAGSADAELESNLDFSLLLSLEAYHASPTVQAESAMLVSLEAARSSGFKAILNDPNSQGVYGVAFSPRGGMLAAADENGTVVLWNTRAPRGKPIILNDPNSNGLAGVAFSPDGGTLAAADGNGSVVLWNTRAPGDKPIILKDLRSQGVYGVAFSPDGGTLAAADDNGSVVLWNTHTHSQLGQPLKDPNSQGVDGVVFSPDGSTVAAADDNGTVVLWDTRAPRGKPIILKDPRSKGVNGVAFSPDGGTVAAADENGTVVLWKTRAPRGKPIILKGLGSQSVYGVAFSPDGETLAAADQNGTAVLWKTRAPRGKPIILKGLRSQSVYAVAFSPDGGTVAAADDNGSVALWNTHTHARLGQPLKDPNSKGVYAVAFSPDGGTLAAAARDGTVVLWKTRAPHSKPIILNDPHSQGVDAVAFSPDGGTVAAADETGTVVLWKTRAPRGKPIILNDPNSKGVYAVAFSPDGGTLAAADDNGSVVLWDTRAPRGRPVILNDPRSQGVNGVAFSPDGGTLAAADENGTVVLWTTRAPRGKPVILKDPRSQGVDWVAFSPDGGTLAAADDNGSVVLWNTRDPRGKPIILNDPNSQGVYAVAFSPDGGTLAAADDNGSVVLWNTRAHARLGQPLEDPNSKGVYAVAFSPDGGTLAAADLNGSVVLWGGIFWHNLAELESTVCGLAWGNLTPTQWQTLAPGLPYRTACPG